jgi:hypothetical protein
MSERAAARQGDVGRLAIQLMAGQDENMHMANRQG